MRNGYLIAQPACAGRSHWQAGLAAVLGAAMLGANGARAQQVVDSAYVPPHISQPAYPAGAGPVVVIDEAHQNFHTMGARYLPFARLLRADGYVVRAGTTRYDSTALAGVRLLVIANALHPANARGQDWKLPVLSAFDSAEVAAIERWVRNGGSVWLIADHMPFAGAIADLARPLGIFWINGFAFPESAASNAPGGNGLITYRRSDGSLDDAPVTRGRNAGERIDSVVTFTGSAFRLSSQAADSALPVLVFRPHTRVWLPRVAWQFGDTVASLAGDGLLQGALLSVGRGRVAAFGEAAMFSAQVTGPRRVPMGMNAPFAPQNAQFALNVAHWLTGELPRPVQRPRQRGRGRRR